MKFTDALRACQAPLPPDAGVLTAGLACGCTANHLQVFLTAHLRALFPERRVVVECGLYGDCLGNVGRLAQKCADGLAVVVEWPDLDPRLGLRQTGGWSPHLLPDILAYADEQAGRFQEALLHAAAKVPVAVCLPTLPLPPVAYSPGWQFGDFEVRLRARLLALAGALVERPGIRLVNPQRLDQQSPSGQRLDVSGELLSGLPYRTPHASVLTELLAALLRPAAPKKGLITDLDDTLWRGLLGEAGVDGVSWSLDRHTHAHALYQQLLQSLADSGVLVAVASKNDPDLVEQAFRRHDLLLRRECVFPVESHWGPKSESVTRILRAWNVAADSVVFVDDSPLELAEVKSAHPDVHTVLFPKEAQAVYDELGRLRDLFGKTAVREEDRLRLDSLRRAAELVEARPASGTDRDDFLHSLGAELAVTAGPDDPRALELVNKTNQFNLNGRRFAEAEWQAGLQEAGAFLRVVSYRDRFGPLGKIAVLCGRHEGAILRVDTWVMSCRAFSRRIEHMCLRLLFEEFGAEEIRFDFRPTPRNGPLQEFFGELLGQPPAEGLRLARARFERVCPPLFHKVEVPTHG